MEKPYMAAREAIRRFLGPERLGRLRKARQRLGKAKQRQGYVRWLTSREGTKPENNLRSLVPSRTAYLLMSIDAICRGQTPPPRRLFIPSPPIVKVAAIMGHARHYGTRLFVETGTCAGATIAAVADLFDECITIELSDDLHERAARRFRGIDKIKCLRGDSGKLMPDIVSGLKGPALFWLDAHYSGGETANAGYDPILAELSAIISQNSFRHIILIDDARDHILDDIRQIAPHHTVTVRNDIVRLIPVA